MEERKQISKGQMMKPLKSEAMKTEIYVTMRGLTPDMNGNPTSVPPIPVTWNLGRGGTTVTNSGGRDVTWNWLQRLPQPQIVSIAGNEGRKIEIDHNSPDVVILGIFDRNNNRVQISGRTSFQHLWQMKHIIQAN